MELSKVVYFKISECVELYFLLNTYPILDILFAFILSPSYIYYIVYCFIQ